MKLSLIIVLAGMAATGARAATSHVESFTGSLNGWTNSGSPAWRATNDCAQVTFAASPAPQTSTLLATGAWTSAAFTGDYAEAGLRLLGFRFRAVHVLPSVLTVRWTSGSTGYFRNLQTELATTGTWHQFYFSLQDKAAGTGMATRLSSSRRCCPAWTRCRSPSPNPRPSRRPTSRSTT